MLDEIRERLAGCLIPEDVEIGFVGDEASVRFGDDGSGEKRWWLFVDGLPEIDTLYGTRLQELLRLGCHYRRDVSTLLALVEGREE